VDKPLDDKALQITERLEELLNTEHTMTKDENYSGLVEVIEKKNNLLYELLSLTNGLDQQNKAFINAFITKLQIETEKHRTMLGDEKSKLQALLTSMQKKKKHLQVYSDVIGTSDNE
jgi:flagellar biosynthesis chaperone FliJ